MDESLTIALMITVIGMSLLFLSLVFFYGLLSLLARIKDKAPSPVGLGDPGQAAPGVAAPGETGQVGAIAAIAVALARAEAELERGPGGVSGAPALDGGGKQVSAWWALHHQRQLANPNTRRET